MKYCENCGKEIPDGGEVCLHCGKMLNKNNKPEKKKKKKKWLIIVFVLIVIIAIAGGDDNEENSDDNISNEITNIEYTSIDIDVLEDDLNNNAAAASEKYKGKYFEITGRLGTIDSDLKYISLLSTTDDWDFTGVHCNIKNDATKDIVKTLSKDQTIIVKGKITDVGEVLGYYLNIDEIIIP